MFTKKSFSLAVTLVLIVIGFSFVTKASAAPAQVDPMMANPSPTEVMNATPVSPAAMMGNDTAPGNANASSSASSTGQQDITVGQNLFLKFKNNPPSCQSLSSDDFAKIGEYMLTQQLGAAPYMQMGQMIPQDTEKQDIYMAVGKNATACNTSAVTPAPTAPMMNDTKTPMETSSLSSPIVLGVGIGMLAVMLLNVILTIVVLSKMKGNKEIKPKNDTAGGIKPSTPTSPAPSSHTATASPLFSSGPAPVPPTSPVHPTPLPDHTPPPSMHEDKTPPPSHEPPKPPMFS